MLLDDFIHGGSQLLIKKKVSEARQRIIFRIDQELLHLCT